MQSKQRYRHNWESGKNESAPLYYFEKFGREWECQLIDKRKASVKLEIVASQQDDWKRIAEKEGCYILIAPENLG